MSLSSSNLGSRCLFAQQALELSKVRIRWELPTASGLLVPLVALPTASVVVYAAARKLKKRPNEKSGHIGSFKRAKISDRYSKDCLRRSGQIDFYPTGPNTCNLLFNAFINQQSSEYRILMRAAALFDRVVIGAQSSWRRCSIPHSIQRTNGKLGLEAPKRRCPDDLFQLLSGILRPPRHGLPIRRAQRRRHRRLDSKLWRYSIALGPIPRRAPQCLSEADLLHSRTYRRQTRCCPIPKLLRLGCRRLGSSQLRDLCLDQPQRDSCVSVRLPG